LTKTAGRSYELSIPGETCHPFRTRPALRTGVSEPVHLRVGDFRLPDRRMPIRHGKLRGNDRAQASVAVVEDLEQRKSIVGQKPNESETGDDEERSLGESGDILEVGSIASIRAEHGD
jgi:hypothetical protein